MTFDQAEPKGFAIQAPSQEITADAGMNEVVGIGEPNRYILKSPHTSVFNSADELALYEALILAHLNDFAPEPPVTIPELLNCNIFSKKPSNLLTFVPGETLDATAIDGFSRAERQRLGRDLGRFVIWLSTAIQPKEQQAISKETGYTPRTRKQAATYIFSKLADDIVRDFPSLAEAICETYYEYQALDEMEEKLQIVGHDDLRPVNLIFATDTQGQHTLSGVIDFGVTKITDINHELRHALQMGEDIFEEAAMTYEAHASVTPNLEQVMLHCRTQLLVDVFLHVNKKFNGNPPKLLAESKRFFPKKDWSELEG